MTSETYTLPLYFELAFARGLEAIPVKYRYFTIVRLCKYGLSVSIEHRKAVFTLLQGTHDIDRGREPFERLRRRDRKR